MSEKIKEIPYGVSDFEKIRIKNKYFVDKTGFIRILEKFEYVFFIRPRRFGKSLWLSILENYYDIGKKDNFETHFKDTDIGKNPTSEQSSYLILRFDFSQVSSDIDKVEQSFEHYGTEVILDFFQGYHDLFEPDFMNKLETLPTVATKLSSLFLYSARKRLKIYVMIDEYDNFTNTVLSTQGKEAYFELTRGEGFFRNFFSILKGGTARHGAGISRLFITGVSPVTLDDVTSGFNIGKNLSLSHALNEMLGFTAHEVRELLEYYKNAGSFIFDTEQSIKLMHKWYDGYIFSKKGTVSMFNPDMVLYFVSECNFDKELPDNFIDQNVKIDYGKLRHLMLVNKKLNGNFDQLKTIVDQGRIISNIALSFPLDRLLLPGNFISLLYYFGFLTFNGTRRSKPVLSIPNLTVRHLIYEYIRDAYEDVNIFRIDFLRLGELLEDMAWDKKWRPLFDFLAKEVKEQTSIRDYLHNEKVIQGFLLAYLSISDIFIPHTEYELNKGYSDFFLEPFLEKYPDMPYGYVIELKYIPRKDKLTDNVLKNAVHEAKNQLDQYAKDKNIKQKYKKTSFVKLVLVYHGWEMVYAGDC